MLEFRQQARAVDAAAISFSKPAYENSTQANSKRRSENHSAIFQRMASTVVKADFQSARNIVDPNQRRPPVQAAI
jgi:hypothetical protein